MEDRAFSLLNRPPIRRPGRNRDPGPDAYFSSPDAANPRLEPRFRLQPERRGAFAENEKALRWRRRAED